MNHLRSAAVAGPGPQTWLYRSGLAMKPRPSLYACLSNPISTRPLHTSSTTYGARTGHYSGDRPDRAYRLPTRPSTYKLAKPSADQSAPPKPDPPEDVILLGAPPDYPIDDLVYQLHESLDELSLSSAIKAWAQLWDLGCVSRLSLPDFEHISNCIWKILFAQRTYPHLGRMAVRHPSDFGHLRNMAVESAARSHCSGLYGFMLKLIGTGRPKDVVDAFEKCKERMRDVQGKKKEDLVSWDREKRLSARLEGEGLKDIMMMNIAAHTLLGTLDEFALFSMLDSQVDLRPSSPFDFRPIERAFRACQAGDQTYDQFRKNVDKLVLSLMCYHPNALIARIMTLGTQRSSDQLEKLYDKVLEASIGPHAFLRPRDLSDFGTVHRNIPIPPNIWMQFIRGFEWRSDVDRIAKMMDEDLPQRGLKPDAEFLSMAMLHMAIIAHRRNAPSSVRLKARDWVDEYWRRLSSAGWHTKDGSFARRIRTLSILSFDERRLQSEIKNLYKAAKEGHLGRIGSQTRASFIEFFMKHAGQNVALKKSWEVLQVFPFDKDNKEDDLDIAVSVFIRRLALGPWKGEEKLKMMKKVLILFVKNGFQVQSHALGPLLSIQLSGGLPIKDTIETILEATRDKVAPDHGIQRWTKVLYGLLTKWTHSISASVLELQAGLFILEKSTEMELYGTTRSRQVGMWMSFIGPAAKSTHTNAAQRQEFIEIALNLFPGGKDNISMNMYFEIIQMCFNRPDGAGYGEGWRRWQEIKNLRRIPPIWWSRLLSLSLKHNKQEFALELVKDAWQSNEIDTTEGFFLRAKAAGLMSKLGLDDQLEIEQIASVNRQNVRNGKRRHREPLAFAEDSREQSWDINGVENEDVVDILDEDSDVIEVLEEVGEEDLSD
ncbi:uncharacterized protein IL334_007365 [Kwoniella shivajii]|uniref:Pentatricopeptide repeat domain-containing protein n=1 Tax=Kwoniella shivajii TaxID=564305 RepID=A0ABZ1D9V2_9TREE|nr:hypothetical protein IL334_007365 [Kwoniella shivajii]